MTFPLHDGSDWTLPDAALEEFQRDYPQIDVEREFINARTWLKCNPDRRKTARGMMRYLGAWLIKAEASGRAPKPTALPEVPDWWAECLARHDGACTGRYAHHLKMTGALS